MTTRPRLAGLLAACLGAASCGPEAADDGRVAFSVRDSAGVTITESAAPAWTDETAWRVEPTPEVVIGSRDGSDPASAFGRVGGVDVLSDGRVVVADVMANEIRVFAGDGRYLLSLGGSGEGPSEFGRLDRIAALAGDSVVGRDVSVQKSVIFAGDGSGSRAVTGPPMFWNDLVAVYVAGWLPDGSAVVSHTVQTSEYPPGTAVVDAAWHLFDPAGAHRGELPRLPVQITHNEGEGAASVTFSPRGRIAAVAGGVWYGFPERFELTRLGLDGVDHIVRLGREPAPVTDAMRTSYRAWYAETSRTRAEGYPPELRDLVEARIEQLTFAETLPAYGRILAAKDGHLWLEGIRSPEELSDPSSSWDEGWTANRWTVLSPRGRWLGTVEIPPGLSLRAVTADRVVGVRTDELGVQYVVAHRLVKPR